MQSRYDEAAAKRAIETRAPDVSEPLALRTYTARLLGSDPALVLHGGGNTSVKAQATDVFGKPLDVLYVKGSGWDLATIEPAGHPAVRLAPLLELLTLSSMTDEQMVNAMRLALLDANAPTPSVETLLHAALPARFIDHTHADAVLAIADQPDAERICREIWGEQLLFIPYVMPGFGLAVACKRAWDAAVEEGRAPTVMILERHGIFTFGETGKESYERMIAAVTRAENAVPPLAASSAANASIEAAQLLPVVRGVLARLSGAENERAPIVVVRQSPSILAFLARQDARELSQRGPATPDHVLRTKPVPLFFAEKNADAETIERAVAAYARTYDAYFDEQSKKKNVAPKKLDPWPRVLLFPNLGIVATGKTKKDAEIAADIYEHTVGVIQNASRVGVYTPVDRGHAFDVEYWSLEQAKLKKAAQLPMAEKIAVITGAASGIGRATAARFLELGAHVVLCDRDESALETTRRALGEKRSSMIVARVADVTDETSVRAVFDLASRTFGGVDVVVSNAGNAPEGLLHTEQGQGALAQSLDLNFRAHNVVATAAVDVFRRTRRPGAVLFNASKSAFNPGPGFGPYAVAKAALIALMRQYAVDLGKEGIRANAVNADRIRTNIFGGGVLESRAKARGLEVDDYFRANLLGREVTADDVADAFAYLALARATTGCIVTVDGGNAAAFPR